MSNRIITFSKRLHSMSERKAFGFTLIELLIVMAIIAILVSLTTVNFIGIRERARDAQRKSDIAQIQIALELFRSDSGAYPTAAQYPTSCNGVFENTTGTVYIRKMPCDPLNTTTGRYTYLPTAGGYCLRACFENGKEGKKDPTNNSVPGCAMTACPSGKYSYTVQNP